MEFHTSAADGLTDTSSYFDSSHEIWVSVPSVGNVGQLAMDALIATKLSKSSEQRDGEEDHGGGFVRVGFLDSDLVLAMVSNDPFGGSGNRGEVHTAVEVYHWRAQKLTFIHVRSLIVHERLFAQQMIQFLKKQQVERVVLLSSASSAWKTDRYLREEREEMQHGKMMRSLTNAHAQKRGDFQSTELVSVAPPVDIQDEHEKHFKSGITAGILDQSDRDSSISIMALLVLCGEGVGNINEGLHLAHVAMSHLMHDPQEKVVVPASWSHLFGSVLDSSLY